MNLDTACFYTVELGKRQPNVRLTYADILHVLLMLGSQCKIPGYEPANQAPSLPSRLTVTQLQSYISQIRE